MHRERYPAAVLLVLLMLVLLAAVGPALASHRTAAPAGTHGEMERPAGLGPARFLSQATPTATATATPTATPTATATATASPTPTSTATATATATPTAEATATPTTAPTETPTGAPAVQPTVTAVAAVQAAVTVLLPVTGGSGTGPALPSLPPAVALLLITVVVGRALRLTDHGKTGGK